MAQMLTPEMSKVFWIIFAEMSVAFREHRRLFKVMDGYELESSSIALLGRAGGGIYSEAAKPLQNFPDKNEYGWEEYDKRNSAYIADDAKLFGASTAATCAALVLVASSNALRILGKLMYPVLVSSLGIAVGVVSLVFQTVIYKV